jgi:hypothetical protein
MVGAFATFFRQNDICATNARVGWAPMELIETLDVNKCVAVDNDSYDLNLYQIWSRTRGQTYKILIAALHMIEAL